MAGWEELRLTLARLLEDRPRAVTSYPGLDRDDGGTPPYPIGLAPWAEAVARDLHGRFGDQVDLTVGALPYPPGRAARRPRPSAEPAASGTGSLGGRRCCRSLSPPERGVIGRGCHVHAAPAQCRQLILIVKGHADRAAVPVVPRSLLHPPVTADPGPAIPSYDMNAAFMSLQLHGSGIHALWSGHWRGQCDESLFPVHAAADGGARTAGQTGTARVAGRFWLL
jgi:hypothetical protein